MTKEDAIEILNSVLEEWVMDDNVSIPREEALRFAIKALEQEPILDKIRDEIEKQEKWLIREGYTTRKLHIAFDSIRLVLAESEDKL